MKITPNSTEIEVDVEYDCEPAEPMVWTPTYNLRCLFGHTWIRGYRQKWCQRGKVVKDEPGEHEDFERELHENRCTILLKQAELEYLKSRKS